MFGNIGRTPLRYKSLITNNRLKIILTGLFMILCLLVIYLGSYSFKFIELTHEDGRIENVRLPYFRDGEERSQIYHITVDKRFYTQTFVRAYPDLCIESIKINEILMDYDENYNETSKCATWNGIELNLGKYLTKGINQIEINVSNPNGFKYGLALKHSFKDWKFNILLFIIYLAFILFLIYLRREGTNIIWILILICFVIRISYIILGTMPELYIYNDVAYYDGQAQSFIEGRLYPPVATLWQPGYYIVLGGAYSIMKIIGIYDLKYSIVPFIHAILFSLSLFFIYKITRKIGNESAAILASIIYTLYYPLIHINVFMMSENLFFPFLALAIYLIVCHSDENKPWTFLLIGIVIGLATDIRATLLIFIPILIFWLITYNKYNFYDSLFRRTGKIKGNKGKIKEDKTERNKFFLSILMIIIGIILCLASLSLFNYKISEGRTKFISGGGGINFALAWCNIRWIEYHGAYIWNFGPPAMTDYDSTTRVTVTTEFTNQSHYYKMGLKCIVEKPQILLRQVNAIYKLFDSLIYPKYDNMYRVDILLKANKIFMLIILIPLSIIELISSIILNEKNKKYFVLLWCLVISIIFFTYISVPGEERYMLPFNFIFIIIGSIGIYSIYEILKQKFMNY